MDTRRKERRVSKRKTTRDNRWVYLAGGALAVAGVIALIVVGALTRGGDEGPAPGDQVIVPGPRPADVPRDGLVYGDPAAPVTITEYADFQ
jgi:protein-disulfide isomerase